MNQVAILVSVGIQKALNAFFKVLVMIALVGIPSLAYAQGTEASGDRDSIGIAPKARVVSTCPLGSQLHPNIPPYGEMNAPILVAPHQYGFSAQCYTPSNPDHATCPIVGFTLGQHPYGAYCFVWLSECPEGYTLKDHMCIQPQDKPLVNSRQGVIGDASEPTKQTPQRNTSDASGVRPAAPITSTATSQPLPPKSNPISEINTGLIQGFPHLFQNGSLISQHFSLTNGVIRHSILRTIDGNPGQVQYVQSVRVDQLDVSTVNSNGGMNVQVHCLNNESCVNVTMNGVPFQTAHELVLMIPEGKAKQQVAGALSRLILAHARIPNTPGQQQ